MLAGASAPGMGAHEIGELDIGHPGAKVGAGKADVTEQMVVELQHGRQGTAPVGAKGEGRKEGSHLSCP